MNLEALKARLGELVAHNQEIVNLASSESRDLTEAEAGDLDANLAEIEKVSENITRAERIQNAANLANASAGRRTTPGITPAPTNSQRPATVPAAPRNADARWGFSNMGDFARSVRDATRSTSSQAFQRFQNAATTFGQEAVGEDGGFAVPPEFRREIWKKVMGEENLLTRTNQLQTSGNSITYPKDETTPWQTSGGIQVYWEAEGGAVTQSRPQLKMEQQRLEKLMALVPVSEELLEDAPALESWLRAKAPEKMASKINTAIIDGTGAGQPLGILRAPCLVTVAANSGQVADTILFENVNKMWSRMYAPCRRNAVWLINQDIEPQLNGMAFDPAATSKVPVYLPVNGLSSSPYSTLFGRPVIPVEACKTLGDAGDIILADLSQYNTLLKAGQEIRTDVSMHLFFDQALMAFRFMFRVNGQPAWGSSITPQNGNTTRSCFVTLEAR